MIYIAPLILLFRGEGTNLVHTNFGEILCRAAQKNRTISNVKPNATSSVFSATLYIVNLRFLLIQVLANLH